MVDLRAGKVGLDETLDLLGIHGHRGVVFRANRIACGYHKRKDAPRATARSALGKLQPPLDAIQASLDQVDLRHSGSHRKCACRRRAARQSPSRRMTCRMSSVRPSTRPRMCRKCSRTRLVVSLSHGRSVPAMLANARTLTEHHVAMYPGSQPSCAVRRSARRSAPRPSGPASSPPTRPTTRAGSASSRARSMISSASIGAAART